jgi:hypothetical protein
MAISPLPSDVMPDGTDILSGASLFFGQCDSQDNSVFGLG